MKGPVQVAAVVLLAFIGGSVLADEAEPFRMGAEKSGRPQRFTPPEYPRDAIDRHITGYVDVEGTVDGNRKLIDPHRPRQHRLRGRGIQGRTAGRFAIPTMRSATRKPPSSTPA